MNDFFAKQRQKYISKINTYFNKKTGLVIFRQVRLFISPLHGRGVRGEVLFFQQNFEDLYGSFSY